MFNVHITLCIRMCAYVWYVGVAYYIVCQRQATTISVCRVSYGSDWNED